MHFDIHFISGLPRAGSTLLSAILRQNPRFHAGMTGPMGSLVEGLLRSMSMANETGIFITDAQREAMLRGLFATYYAGVDNRDVVFDTNRLWCTKLPLLTALFPQARFICCVRDVNWVLDSIERLIRKNKFQPSGIFGFEPGGTVYSRVDVLGGGGGLVGHAWNALREAVFGEQSDRLLFVTYETLTSRPEAALAAIYNFIHEPPFAHDFENVDFDATEFDRRLGTPGLHAVGRRVHREERTTVLPPDIVRKYESDTFWRDPSRMPPHVKVV